MIAFLPVIFLSYSTVLIWFGWRCNAQGLGAVYDMGLSGSTQFDFAATLLAMAIIYRNSTCLSVVTDYRQFSLAVDYKLSPEMLLTLNWYHYRPLDSDFEKPSTGRDWFDRIRFNQLVVGDRLAHTSEPSRRCFVLEPVADIEPLSLSSVADIPNVYKQCQRVARLYVFFAGFRVPVANLFHAYVEFSGDPVQGVA